MKTWTSFVVALVGFVIGGFVHARAVDIAPSPLWTLPVFLESPSSALGSLAPLPSFELVSQKVLSAKTWFGPGETALRASQRVHLDNLASRLRAVDVEMVVAVGYAHTNDKSNDPAKLSWQRAQAVKTYLVSKGIDPERVYTEGRGLRTAQRAVDIEVVANDFLQ